MKPVFRICTQITTAALLFLSTGCEKYLDKEPDNRTQIKTLEQLGQLLTTAYPNASYILFCESMSDNAEDKENSGSGYDFADQINSQSYRFEEVEVAPDNLDSPTFYWNACYKAIAAANQALEIIRNMPVAEREQARAYQGEALVARAYSHFMLVTLFARVFNPTTSSSDPGIPYVTEPEKEVFVRYDRHTVSYVYEMIEKDLLEGYPLIDDRIYKEAPKFHFNRKAAAAFAARFYLFKQEFDKVITYATEALGSRPAESIRPWNTVLTSFQYNELEAEYTKSSTAGNLLLQEANSIWGRSYPSLRYSLGDAVANNLLARPNATGAFYAYDLYGATPQSYNIPKFYEHFVRESLNANSGTPYITIPLLTAEEALFNRAEAYLWTNKNADAIRDLNEFASRNMDEYNPATDNLTSQKMTSYYGMSLQPAILNTILDFKRTFFMHEGMRWFDIIRLGIPVLHTTRSGEIFELGPNDNRRVLQLPALTKDAGLEPNPR